MYIHIYIICIHIHDYQWGIYATLNVCDTGNVLVKINISFVNVGMAGQLPYCRSTKAAWASNATPSSNLWVSCSSSGQVLVFLVDGLCTVWQEKSRHDHTCLADLQTMIVFEYFYPDTDTQFNTFLQTSKDPYCNRLLPCMMHRRIQMPGCAQHIYIYIYIYI